MPFECDVVYFDEKVRDASGKWIGGVWISLENAKRIAEYFLEKHFGRKDSPELGKWMNRMISSQECANTTVVFAQDVAPYDVYDDISSNALVRQYLDNGGTILWMGDVPFFYRTQWKEDHFERESTDNAAEWGALGVLGVLPVSMIVASRSSINSKGHEFGLKTEWASRRPIVIPSQLETDRTRIGNFIMNRREYVELAHAEGVGIPWVRPFERKGHLKRFLEFLGTSTITAGSVEISAQPSEKSSLEFGIKYLSAWIKVFDLKIPGRGFIRIWDYAPRVVTDQMLNEAFTLVRNYRYE